MAKYLTAVVVCNLPQGGNQFLKYRNIIRTPGKLRRLLEFAAREIPDVHHINLYEKETKRFVKQIGQGEIERLEVPAGIC